MCSRSCWIVVRFGDSIEKDNNIFGVDASMEESSRALIVGELFLFRKLSISPITCVDPLTRW
jgi:fructose-specific component phosphotransferase system IIB-like protein